MVAPNIETIASGKKKTTEAPISYMYYLMTALNGTNNSMNKAQITDAKAAEFAAQQQSVIYAWWNSSLESAAQNIAEAAKSGQSVPVYQSYFTMDQSKMNAATTQQQGYLSKIQGQVGQDGTNMQQFIQNAGQVLALMPFLASLIQSA